MAVSTTENTKKKGSKAISEADLARMERQVSEQLKGQPKETVIITKTNNPEDTVWRGWMNGREYAFPLNEPVEVPRDLAKMISLNAKVIKQKEALEKKLAKGVDLT